MPPKRNTVETLNLFADTNVVVICEDTLKLELGCVAVLCGNSEVGKSFLALKICADCINEGYKPFFWSIEDKNKAILERIQNIDSFYPFEVSCLEFSNELPNSNKKTPEERLEEELESLSDCDLIVLDTFSVFFSQIGFKDQNNQNDVQSFFNVLIRIATKNNQAILLIHHLDKKGESIMGSSVIKNAPRLVYQLSFPQSENKNTTTYRHLSVLKDSNNINAGEYSKIIKILDNQDIDEPLMKNTHTKEEKIKILEPLHKKDITYFYENAGYVTMNESRGLFYLSSTKLQDTEFYKKFRNNDNQYEFKMQNPNGSSYAITLKNKLLNQTHRSILDAIFLYIKNNIELSEIKKHQNNDWDMTIRIEPYEFLKKYMNKSSTNYAWLKEKLVEFGRFAYDLSYSQLINGDEKIVTLRDRNILTFDSVEHITKHNGRVVAIFVLTINSRYIKRLYTESSLAYNDEFTKLLVNLSSQAVQDLVRFLASFPDKKILSFKEFCEIKVYRAYKSPVVISRQKKEFIKAKDELINFGINVYGKNVPFEEYDDEVLANRYKNENDLIFVYESNNKVKRFIKKNDPMNKLNVKNNKFINNTRESSLFDDI